MVKTFGLTVSSTEIPTVSILVLPAASTALTRIRLLPADELLPDKSGLEGTHTDDWENPFRGDVQ